MPPCAKHKRNSGVSRSDLFDGRVNADNLAVRIRKVGHVRSRSHDGVAKVIVDVVSPKAGRKQGKRQY
jgi:hypothetical protein